MKVKKVLALILAASPVAVMSAASPTDSLWTVPVVTVVHASDVPQLRERAASGEAEAMRLLGVCYQTGTGVDKDLEESLRWFGKAARHGSDEAEYDLGVIYRDGIGVGQSWVESAYWFRKSAQNGNLKGMVNIGRQFADGKGVLQDSFIASEYYWRAGARGNAEGQYAYATMLRDGKGVRKDTAKAIEWFQKAADQNYKDAALQVKYLKRASASPKKSKQGAKGMGKSRKTSKRR